MTGHPVAAATPGAPTRLAVSICAATTEELARVTAESLARGADLCEWRLDFLEQPHEAVTLLRGHADWRGRIIATCRSKAECGGVGGFDGDDDERISLLEAIGLELPGYIDLELATYESSANIRQKIHLVCDDCQPPAQHAADDRQEASAVSARSEPPDRSALPSRQKNRLILSAHQFAPGVHPEFVQTRLARMQAYPFAVHKVAWMPAQLALPPDCSGGADAVSIAMSELGLPTRVLAKSVGMHLSFCAPNDATRPAAPGQVRLDDMLGLYRWKQLDAKTRRFGVIGDPVAHSMSPAIHNAGFEVVGYNGVYLPLRIQTTAELHDFLNRVFDPGSRGAENWLGVSVTIPHKEALVAWALENESGRFEVEPLARRIGAANTVVFDPATRCARVFNTDYAGALDALVAGMRASRSDLAGVPVAVLGAGGTARAIVAGLVDHGADVRLFNRTFERATDIASDFAASKSSGRCQALPWELRHSPVVGVPACRVVINTTSVGMHRDSNRAAELESPIDEASIHRDHVIMDAVYNPVETTLLRHAKAAGATVVDGVHMFVNQAALQFEAWTSHPAPRDVFRSIVLQRLARQ